MSRGYPFGNVPVGKLEVCAERDAVEVEAVKEVVGDVQAEDALRVANGGSCLTPIDVVLGKRYVEDLETAGHAEVLKAFGVEESFEGSVVNEVVVPHCELGHFQAGACGRIRFKETDIPGDSSVGAGHSLILAPNGDQEDRKGRFSLSAGGLITDDWPVYSVQYVRSGQVLRRYKCEKSE